MVGNILREEREKQNMSIQDVESETSIRALYISSIEEGKYDVIPGEVYLRGFIKTYANFLSLDANNILQEYKAEKAAKDGVALPEVDNQELDNVDNKVAPQPKEAGKFSLEKPSLREKMAEKRQRSSLYAKVAIGAVAAIICLGSIGYWAFGTASDTTTDNPAVNKSAATATTAKQQSAAANDAKTAPVADKFVTYQAKYTDDCWSKVEADGKVILEETVKKGAVLNWQAEKNLVITAGNAGAVEITANGKSLGFVGKPGEVITKKFTGEKTAP